MVRYMNLKVLQLVYSLLSKMKLFMLNLFFFRSCLDNSSFSQQDIEHVRIVLRSQYITNKEYVEYRPLNILTHVYLIILCLIIFVRT